MDDAALTSRYASELAEAVSLRPQLLRFVHSELRVRFDAEDILQETYAIFLLIFQIVLEFYTHFLYK